MRFNTHSASLAGRHAFLSPSKYHWVNYDDEKLDRVFLNRMATIRGNELHEFAHQAIRLGIKLPDNGKTLSLYVNDAIGYGMSSEQMLYYSDNAFGTADAISFRNGQLRIHDLKTGDRDPSEKQLEVYAALFCLEYGHRPFKIKIETRIYYKNEVRVYEPDPDDIFHIMERIVTFDKRINAILEEVS